MTLRDMQNTHHGVLEEQAERLGDRPYVFFGDAVISFSEMNRRAGHVARGLQKLGIRKGDTVALMMTNKPEFLASWFGIAKTGAIFIPLNTRHRGTVLRHMLGISKTRVIICDAALLEQVVPEIDVLGNLEKIVVLGDQSAKAASDSQMSFSSLVDNDGGYEPVRVRPGDPGIIMFTSGTTGPSKGALKPHNEAVCTADMKCGVMNYDENDCIYLPLPLFHGNALIMGAFAALRAGARLALVERFSASGFWADIERYGCTACNYVGGMISILMKAEERPGDDRTPLVKMTGAGAPLALYEKFQTRFGVTLTEGYGMSEMGVPFLSRPGARKSGTCGKLQDGYEVRLVDDEGNDVPDGAPGELLVRVSLPNYFMLEYVGMPEKTVEAWRGLWFHTGDYLKRDPDGFYIFVDRKKDAIRRRGENISSFEVEISVNGHPAILESAAYGVPSELGEDEVMISVVARPGIVLDLPEFHRFLRSRMADFMVPRYVRVVDTLPKTATERVEKYRLRVLGVTEDTWDATAHA